MSGTNVERPEGRGINYRALEDLFDMVEERKNEVRAECAQMGIGFQRVGPHGPHT